MTPSTRPVFILLAIVSFVMCQSDLVKWMEIIKQIEIGAMQNEDNNFREKKEVPIKDTYDFIVVGSGSAGSALANRLTENPDWNVLLLEVGEEPNALLDIPGIVVASQFTHYNWQYLMERQDNMCLGLIDERMHWPHGRGLGGSTLINYMIHVRGNRLDFDRWAAAGNPGWSYKDVLPYFRKLEDSHVALQDGWYRNLGGPVGVEDVPFRTPSVDVFVKAAQEAGYPYVDYNGETQMGVSYVQSTSIRGMRCSVERAYLRKIRSRPNLTVSVKSLVTRLLIDSNKKVYGVEYFKAGRYKTAQATKEVILSAGAFNSPQLLILSGIGPKEHLQELGIPILQNLPVGRKMYDHIAFLGLVFSVNTTLTLNIIKSLPTIFKYFENGKSILSTLGGVEALLYMKTNVSNEIEFYPDVEVIYLGGGIHTDFGSFNRRAFRIKEEIYQAIWKQLEGKEAWSVFPMLLHPRSVGYMKLKSSNPFDVPLLYGNYFTDPGNLDVATFIAAIREIERIAQSPTYQKYDTKLVRTPVPGCQHLSFDSDAYWECALRHLTVTLHHQVATCKMGPPTDPEAVVDHELRVYGIKGLRVVDTSVIPMTPSAHTNVPTIMIGEKAADMIKKSWRMNL